MSCYEWEHGEITLPSTEVADLKARLREAHNRLLTYTLEACKNFWVVGAKRTRSTKKYREALYARTDRRDYGGYGMSVSQEQERALKMAAQEMAFELLSRVEDAPRQVTKQEVEKYLGGKATVRTTVFRCGWEASISFKGRVATWDVPENNHASEHAYSQPLAQIFFYHLNNRVRWTRGTGGVITGNNEYSRDSYDVGGGGNYVVRQFGPKGEKVTGVRVAARSTR